jgi:hypothetical protein
VKSFGPKMKNIILRIIWALLAIPAFIALGGLTFLVQLFFSPKEAVHDFVKGFKELVFYVKNGYYYPYEEDLNDNE